MGISKFAEEELERQAKTKEQLLEMARHLAPYRLDFAKTFEAASRNAMQGVLAIIKTQQLQQAIRFTEQMNKMTAQIVAPKVAADFEALLGSVSFRETASIFTARTAVATALKGIAEAQQQISASSLARLRENLQFDYAPVLAALNTMRTFDLENISPQFHDFVEEAFEEIDTTDETTVTKKILTVAKIQTSELTQYQQFQLTTCLTILGILIALYAAIQAGKPINIDPTQFDQLIKRYPEMSPFLQVFTQASVTAFYEVDRTVELKLRPTNRSVTLVRVEPGEPVRLLRCGITPMRDWS